MKAYVCQCGSNSFKTVGQSRFCEYCGTEYTRDSGEKETVIDIHNDIKKLLDKCKQDPSRASLYAGLVLDIDPFNEEALRYL